MQIIPATPNDLPSIVAMLNSYVRLGFIGLLRDQEFDLAERKAWFSQFSPSGPHRILVAKDGDRLLGVVSSFAYRGGGVFGRTIETSIYTAPDAGGKGIGSRLYGRLFEELATSDLHRAVVGIALPNDASVDLHRRFGFTDIGVFDEYAYFQGKYVSSLWMQKKLGAVEAIA